MSNDVVLPANTAFTLPYPNITVIEEAAPATPSLWNIRYTQIDLNFSAIKIVIDALIDSVGGIEEEIDSGIGGFMFETKPWFGSNEAVPEGYFLASGVTIQEAVIPGIIALIKATGQPWIAEAEWRANAAQRGKWGIGDGFVLTPDFNGEYVPQSGEPASIGGVFLGGGVFALAGSLHGSQNLSHSHGAGSSSSGGSGGVTIQGGNNGDFGVFRENTSDQTVSGYCNNRPQGSSGGGSYYYATINLANHTHTFSIGADGGDEARPRTARTRWVIQCFGSTNVVQGDARNARASLLSDTTQRILALEAKAMALPTVLDEVEVERFPGVEYVNCSNSPKRVTVEFEAFTDNASLVVQLLPSALRSYVPLAGKRGSIAFEILPWKSYSLVLDGASLIQVFEG